MEEKRKLFRDSGFGCLLLASAVFFWEKKIQPSTRVFVYSWFLMSKRAAWMAISLLNDEQMSNRLGVEHQPVVDSKTPSPLAIPGARRHWSCYAMHCSICRSPGVGVHLGHWKDPLHICPIDLLGSIERYPLDDSRYTYVYPRSSISCGPKPILTHEILWCRYLQ